MSKIALLKISWTFFIVGFLTAIVLMIISIKNDILTSLGAIIFFSIMFLAGFISINIQYKK